MGWTRTPEDNGPSDDETALAAAHQRHELGSLAARGGGPQRDRYGQGDHRHP